jgi:uncharacterized protein with GYD domain
LVAKKEEQTMATYLTLIKFTGKGAKNIKDTCKRAANFKAEGKSLGIDVKAQHWCLGSFDGFILFDAPDDETAAAAAAHLAAQEFVTTQTERAFTAQEMSGIVAK